MRIRGSCRKACVSGTTAAILFTCLLFFSAVLPAQILRLPLNGNAPVVSVRTCQETLPAGVSGLEPPLDRIVVVVADTTSADDSDKLEAEISARYRDSGRGASFRFAMLRGSELQVSEPIANAGRLKTEIKQLLASVGGPAASGDAATIYSSLKAVVKPAIEAGAAVVLLGRFPSLDRSLEGYATAYLTQAFLYQKLRVSYRDLRSTDDSVMQSQVLEQVAMLTGGQETNGKNQISEITWPQPTFTKGFRFCTGGILSEGSTQPTTFPHLEMERGFRMPDIGGYGTLLQLKSKNLNSADGRKILEAALAINPGDSEVMRKGANFFGENKDPQSAAYFLDLLIHMDSANGKLYLEYGHQLYLAQEYAGAERALVEGRRLGAASAEASEELGRIYVIKKDFKSALVLVDDSLQQNPKNQKLWFFRATIFAATNGWEGQADSLEKGLALGGAFLDYRTALIQLYLANGQPAKAAPHVDAELKSLPANADVNSTWAGFLESMRRPGEAIGLWRKVIVLDPKREHGYDSLCHLLTEKSDLPASLEVADAGLRVFPQSARLNLCKVSSLELQGKTYAARHILAGAAETSDDVALLQHAAEVEDRFGSLAVPAYIKLVKVLDSKVDQQALTAKALERGLLVSLREADLEKSAWFEQKLLTLDAERPVLTGKTRKPGESFLLPGGGEALAFIARGKRGSAPERIMSDFCRTVIGITQANNEQNSKLYLESLRSYFQKVGLLLREGEFKNNRTNINLTLADKAARRKTEAVLSILGWKVRGTGKQLVVESGEKSSQAKRQEVATALGIDQGEMQEAFQEGKPFGIEIPWERIPIVLSEAEWERNFYPKEKPVGGLAEAIGNNPRIAKGYIGLSAMDAATSNALIASVGLVPLMEQYGDLMGRYSSSLSVVKGRIMVPGGTTAEQGWSLLVGPNPGQVTPFLKSLLTKDDGRELKYFAAIAGLDPKHQKFVTSTPARVRRFYEVFLQSDDAKGKNQVISSVGFGDFLRNIPLNADNTVDFPGGPEVWLVTNGQSDSTARTAKLVVKARKTAAPEVEDEILVRLAKTHYHAASQNYSELENFLAVARIDEHRKRAGSKPLDDASAILLAQKYIQCSNLYPYFYVLTALTYQDFERILIVGDHIKGRDATELNQIAGQFASALELVSLAVKAETIRQDAAMTLLARFCEGFTRAASDADYSASSLAFLREFARLGANRPNAADADEALRSLLLGVSDDVELEADGMLRPFNAVKTRLAAFERVLDEQKVTSIQVLLNIADSAALLSTGRDNAQAQLKTLEENSAKLIDFEIPKSAKGEGREKTNLENSHPQKLLNIVAQIHQRVGKGKVNPKDLVKLDSELLAELSSHLRLSMSGLVYAYYFNPDDLLVAEDPLLLRKHQFVDLEPTHNRELFRESDLVTAGGKSGTYLLGGFSDFSGTAGHVAVSGLVKSDSNGLAVVSTQIGSLRATNWGKFQDSDQELMALKIRIAREWCVSAALHPELRDDLASETIGLLSLSRRRDLLAALEALDWKTVWSVFSVSDLYFLGDRYLAFYREDPWNSPVSQALRRHVAKNRIDHLQILGGDLKYLNGGGHSHVGELAPYEEFERQYFPVKVAERVSEFKFYLAEYFDRAGLPAQAMPLVAEAAAKKLLRELQMSDLRDWSSVLAVYSKLDKRTIDSVIPR